MQELSESGDLGSGWRSPFDEAAKAEIYEELDKEYVSGITFSGGDPLLLRNREELTEF